MVGCSAFGCTNRSDQGFVMKVFPRDPERRQLWLAKVRRKNWQPTNASYLCEVHFEPDMWERIRVDGKKKLKHKAVPTLFCFSTPEDKHKPPIANGSPSSKPGPSNLLSQIESSAPLMIPGRSADTPPIDNGSPSSKPGPPNLLSQMESSAPLIIPGPSADTPPIANGSPSSKPSPSSLLSQIESYEPLMIPDLAAATDVKLFVPGPSMMSETSTPLYTGKLDHGSSTMSRSIISTEKKEIQALQEKIEGYHKQYDRLNIMFLKCRKNVRALKDQNRRLKTQVENTGAGEIHAGIEFLKPVFNADQVAAMKRKSTRYMKWSNETIMKALKLKFACGTRGYKELLRQNHPLPSLRTLRRDNQMSLPSEDSNIVSETVTKC